MEDFVVSARKYRPSTFNDVVGQAAIVNTLKNAIANRHLAHSFLFCGQRGVGKTTCARILAKTINCEHLTADTEACNECESCKTFNEGRSLNIHELDAASSNSVEDIRYLIEQVRFAPQAGKYKVYIIDEVHMLSAAAFNAFLKTLEEPPSYAIFILATTEKHKIIPTILSRCQIFDFKRIQLKDIASHLAYIAQQEHIEAEPEALHILAEKADGALRDALSLFDRMVSFAGKELTYKKVIENLNILDYDYYFKVTGFLRQSDIYSALLVFNEILANGFDGHLFINGLGEHFRNLLVAKKPSTAVLLEKGGQLNERYIKQAAEYPEAMLFKGLSIISKCDVSYKIAVNQRLLVEIALMKLAEVSGQTFNPHTESKETQNFAPKQSSVVSEDKASYQVPKKAELPVAKPITPEIKPEKPPVIPPKMNFGIISASVSESKNKANDSAANEYVGQTQTSEMPLPVSSLLDAWNQYAIKIKENKMGLYSIMNMFQPVVEVINNDLSLQIDVDGPYPQKELESEKTNILNFIKERLNIKKLDMTIKIVAGAELPRKPYTAQEKYEHLKAKNPDIEKLVDQLGLTIEH